MKTTKLFFIAAILGATFFVSCTPENIEDENTPQQVKGTDIDFVPGVG